MKDWKIERLGNLQNKFVKLLKIKITRYGYYFKIEDLEIWKEAVKIGVEIYKLTSRDKLERDFSSKDQLRRAAISISNNIAEGFEYNNQGVL